MRHPSMNPKHLPRRGFSLIELSVVVAIMSVVAVMGLEGSAALLNRSAYRETQARLVAADAAIQQFFRMYGRFPCPAVYATAPTTITYGLEDCTIAILTNASPSTIGGGVIAGALPFRELNLPRSASLDAYDNKLVYYVTKNLTALGIGGSGTFAYNPVAPATLMTGAQAATAGIEGIEVRTGLLEQPCDTTSCQTLAKPSLNFTTTTGAAYAIVSTGADKRGARSKYAVLQKSCITSPQDDLKIDGQNCGPINSVTVTAPPTNAVIPPNVIYDSRYNAGSQNSNYFDDIVIWRTRGQL